MKTKRTDRRKKHGEQGSEPVMDGPHVPPTGETLRIGRESPNPQTAGLLFCLQCGTSLVGHVACPCCGTAHAGNADEHCAVRVTDKRDIRTAADHEVAR